MSVHSSNIVWRARLRPEQKYILLALVDQANDEGYCIYRRGEEITQAMLAEKTCLSERTIRRQIAEMIESGFIEITRSASHHSPPEYRVRVDILGTLNSIVRGDNMATLRPVDKSGQGGQNGHPNERSEWPSTTVRVAIHDSQGGHPRQSGWPQCPPTDKVLDVEAPNTLSLTTAEREMVEKDLKRLFPVELTSLPAAIPSERAFLFWRKVLSGEIRKGEIYSPVAYMLKMADEEIGPMLEKWRAARSRGG